MQLSRYFTLSDLTTTSTGFNNNPSPTVLSNLRQLALLLDEIYEKIGPFHINSGYRSPSVNEYIGGSNTSLHLEGKAADIRPKNMSAEEFFRKLASSPLKNKTGEIINESERGIVHVSLPTFSLQGVLKYLKDGEYFRYTKEEIEKFFSYTKENPAMIFIALGLITGLTYIYLKGKR